MRTRFRFRFFWSSCVVSADTEIGFFATGSAPSPGDAAATLERARVEFRLSPEAESAQSKVNGSLFVTVPGTPEDSHLLARMLASDLAEHLAFFYPGFRILGGGLTAERLPDTPEEAAAIAGAPFWATITFEEAVPPPTFDPALLKLFPYSRALAVPIAQLNASALATNAVDGYLSAIKVLEFLFHRAGGPLASSFCHAGELREAVDACFAVRHADESVNSLPPAEIDDLLKGLAETRNRCAHLRASGSYGVRPRDPEVASVVEPRLEQVRTLAHHILYSRMEAARSASRAAQSSDTPPGLTPD